MSCDLTALSEQELYDLIKNLLPHAKRSAAEKVAADLWISITAPTPTPEPEPTPPKKGILWGASVGVDGFPAVDRFVNGVLKPAGKTDPKSWCIRTYAAGGIGVQLEKGNTRYPGVPQVYGPKTLTTNKAEIKTYLTKWLRLVPELILTPWPENDRHAIKSGLNMNQWVAMMKAFHEVLRDDFGRSDVLWANPTGWDIPKRWDTYVAPVLDYVDGVAVNGYSWQSETGYTQASLEDAKWCAQKCADHGKKFAGFEMGVEAGSRQLVLLDKMLTTFQHIHDNIVPVERFIYWDTAMGDGSLDCKLSPEALKFFSEFISK